MKLKNTLLSLLLTTAGMGCLAQTAPLKILVGFGVGSTDITARLLAERLKDELNRPVYVETKVGAGGRIAAEALKNSPADGSVIMLAPIVVPVLAPLVYKKLAYNVATDFAPVAHIANFQFGVSVKADSSLKNMNDVVSLMKKDRTAATFGSPAPGSLPHFFGVMIGQKANLDMTHVPYNGGAQLMTALVGGQVTLGIDTLADQGEMHRGGRTRILATSGQQRSPLFPDIPTLGEAGFKDLMGVSWFAVFAPGATDASHITQLNAAINRVLSTPAFKDRLAKLGLEVGGGSPADLKKLIATETERWAPVVKASGFTAE